MLVIWNPSIRKSFGIAVVPSYDYNVFGFGVRPDTSDLTVVKIIQSDNKPWHVEVFTLSSGVWNVIPSSNLVESLVVYGSIYVRGLESCGVWVMQHDSSFKKLFSIGAPCKEILGFKESIIETSTNFLFSTTLDVYDPSSQQINNLGISGTFSMGSYKESLLLLDHSDLHIYSIPPKKRTSFDYI
nr:hypothetical protein [Tanacetum cinerariifolium]